MLKIFSGIYGGRRLKTPPAELRPTSGRTREAAFNILTHGEFMNPDTGEHALSGARVADVCCGSGAMGLEALSRGAEFSAFVELDLSCLATAEENAKAFGAHKDCAFYRADCRELPSVMRAFDVIFLDPPYESDVGSASVRSMLMKGWVRPGTLLVWERPKTQDAPPHEPETWTEVTERAYGRSKLSLFRYTGMKRTVRQAASGETA